MSDLISTPEAPHWTARHGKPIIFVILTLIAVGALPGAHHSGLGLSGDEFPAHRGGHR